MEFNLGRAHDAVAAAVPDRECVVSGGRRLSWAEVADRAHRLAGVLRQAGLGCHTERAALAPWESGQDHVALLLHNGNEYLEAMVGSFHARAVPFNVNYRYVAEELAGLLASARPRAAVFHSSLGGPLVEALAPIGGVDVLLQVDDGSGAPLARGARWYEAALADADPGPADPRQAGPAPSPDDAYLLFTGGTTGLPKGVLWRQADVFVEALGGRNPATRTEYASYEELAAVAAGHLGGGRMAIAAPFMHGTGHWLALATWFRGGTVFIPDHPDHLDPVAVWRLVERERVGTLLIVGDAFARPLADELDAHDYDVADLGVVLSGGAPLSAPLKDLLLAQLPQAIVVDGLGSSEAGGQALDVSVPGAVRSGVFRPDAGTVVLSAALDRALAPGDDEMGWLAKRGRLALGYLGDPAATAATYPVVDGTRYAVAGDRARIRADGLVELHGRDAVTIITGGEKVFAEEVEAALRHHPDVYDCVVAARPSERWGEEVVAVVRLRDGVTADASVEAALHDEAARHLARYKLPKAFAFVDGVRRSPAGKADYRWARAVATATRGSIRSP